MDDSQTTPSIDLKGRSVLIVDDDRVNLKIIGGILRHEGYEISEAGSGEQALEIYAEYRPNLVLLDVMMPGIDGFEACRTLKKTYGETCAPVIFITAKNKADDIVMGFDAGGVDYLTKPFRPKEVLARIRTHLSNQLLLEQLSKANAAKDRFLGMCAHDLRNPLSSIRGLAELMRENAAGSLTDEQMEIVQTIHSARPPLLPPLHPLSADPRTGGAEAGDRARQPHGRADGDRPDDPRREPIHAPARERASRRRDHRGRPSQAREGADEDRGPRQAVGPPERHRGREEEHAGRDGEQDQEPGDRRRPEQDAAGRGQPHQQRGEVLAAGLPDHGADKRG